MDSESTLYKTAELVRDSVGCYYFICLQCGKDFENLEDTVIHIEKYFYEPSDDNDVDAASESDWMANDVDTETVVANIKKESFEEYEDYKLSIPYDYDEGEGATSTAPIFCPLCPKTLSHTEGSLESHLVTVHHRNKKYAKIYECNICGRNSFTRPYDLERHQLTHNRYVNSSSKKESASNVGKCFPSKRNGDRNQDSMLMNILTNREREPIAEALKQPTTVKPVYQSTNVSPNASNVTIRQACKRYIPTNQVNGESLPKKAKPMEIVERDNIPSGSIQGTSSNYCSICQSTFSRKDTLESHLIRVHHRHKHYAKIYECTTCGKNSFTRPYDLRRHELTHLGKRRDHKEALPKKIFKAEPKTDDISDTVQVPLTKQLPQMQQGISPPQSTSNPNEVKKIAADIRTTDPQKDGILCAICDMKFESYLDVTLHLKFAHNQKRIYKCSHENCLADAFSNAFFLHRHEMSHSIHYRKIVGSNPNRLMKCVFCRRNFNKKWNLMKHEKRHLLEMSDQ